MTIMELSLALFCAFVLVDQIDDVYSVEVTLLTTEGATTNLNWDVYNENPDIDGWIDQTIPLERRPVRGYQVCEVVQNSNIKEIPQSWLLIPGINIDGASRIFIEMNFTMRECKDLEKTCRETFSVYYRLSETGTKTDLKNFDPDEYTKIDTVAAEVRFTEPTLPSKDSWNSLVNSETVSIAFDKPTNNTVVLIAIVDVGACMALMGVHVYHKVCPRVIAGLTIFDQTLTGATDTSLISAPGTCVPNSVYPEPSSSPDGSPPTMTYNPKTGETIGPLYHCTSSGEWQVQTGECQCMVGHQPGRDGTECVPCASGTHKINIGNEKCSVCPVHSNTATTGAKTCECDSGFYNTMRLSEQKERPTGSELFDATIDDYFFGNGDCNLCSRTPSPPTGLRIEHMDLDNPGLIELSWNRPQNNGGCHNIKYCIVCEARSAGDTEELKVKNCDHVTYQPSRCHTDHLKVTLGSLRGHVSYKFTVASYNLVTTLVFDKELGEMFDGSAVRSNGNESSNGEGVKSLLDESSSAIEYRTNATLPSSVRDVNLAYANQTSMSLKWKKPEQENGDIVYYEVRWSLVFEDPKETDPSSESASRYISRHSEWNTIVVNDTGVLLTKLYPGSSYDIIISAHNSAGSDNGSVVLRAVTSPIEDPSDEPDIGSDTQPYLIAIVVIAVLVVMIGILLIVQWRYRSSKTKHRHKNGIAQQHKEFRPFNSHHDTLDQRTYVDPFSLTAVPSHRFLCETSPESITCESVIGCGEFGEVYKGTLATIDLKTGQETTIDIAVKQLRDQCEPQEQINFLREAMSLQRFRHPNIVHLEAVVTSSRPFFIVTELMGHGSLQAYLTKLREDAVANGRGWAPPLSHVAMVKMLRGVASGMEYLSGRGFVHRDLAARNVLVNTGLECKVADFGLTRELDCDEGVREGTISNGNGTYTTRGGKIAIRWTAPEAIAFRTFTQFSDVWSFGILVWEAASYGEKPYWDLTNHEVLKAVNDGFRLPAPELCPSVFHQLMLECWHQDHKNRPNFTKIITRLDHMVSVPDLLLIPSSPASSGVEEQFFTDRDLQPPDDLGLRDDHAEVTEPLLTTTMVDRHNFQFEPVNHDVRYELTNCIDDKGSEVSSCTSTICASEITVCATNNVVVYVPICKSDSDDHSSESVTRYSPKGR